MCKECSQIKHDYKDENVLCFFHTTKHIILNNDFEFIKQWINHILNRFKKNYQPIDVDLLNSDFFNPQVVSYTFNNLLYNVYPRILKQKTIHKKNNIFVSNVTNYILSTAIQEHIHIYPDKFNIYIKYVKINVDILDKMISLFREKHFFNCVNIQGMSLNKALFFCYPIKQANDIDNIVNFYRNRDRLILAKLYHLPTPIVSIILNKIG